MNNRTNGLIILCITAGLLVGIVLHEHSIRSMATRTGSSQPMASIRVSKLIGADVRSARGEELGRIKDVVVNPETGDIEFAILGSGATPKKGETLRPVPWKALSVHAARPLMADIERSQLLVGPSLEGAMTDITNPDYVSELNRFYGTEAPTAIGGVGSGLNGAGQGSGHGGPPGTNRPPPLL